MPLRKKGTGNTCWVIHPTVSAIFPFHWSAINFMSKTIIFIFRLRKLRSREVNVICPKSQLISGRVIENSLQFLLRALPHHCHVKWSPISGNTPSSREFKALRNLTPVYLSWFISYDTPPHSLCTIQILGCLLIVLDNYRLSCLFMCWSLEITFLFHPCPKNTLRLCLLN